MLDSQLQAAVLSIPLTSDLRDLMRLIDAEIQARDTETGSTYTISDLTDAPTKAVVIRNMRILTGCDLPTALRTYDQGRFICSPVTAEQRLALESFREFGCTVMKNE